MKGEERKVKYERQKTEGEGERRREKGRGEGSEILPCFLHVRKQSLSRQPKNPKFFRRRCWEGKGVSRGTHTAWTRILGNTRRSGRIIFVRLRSLGLTSAFRVLRGPGMDFSWRMKLVPVTRTLKKNFTFLTLRPFSIPTQNLHPSFTLHLFHRLHPFTAFIAFIGFITFLTENAESTTYSFKAPSLPTFFSSINFLAFSKSSSFLSVLAAAISKVTFSRPSYHFQSSTLKKN